MIRRFTSSWLFVLIIVYVALVLSIIRWGLPSPDSAFLYHMDEWHQLMAIRAIAAHGTTTVEGAANGTMFYFVLSGAFLAVFRALGIVDPSHITTALSDLAAQHRIFLVLRLETLIFGALSLMLFTRIQKTYFKLRPLAAFAGTAFFIFSPIWLSLSGYFKYDVALVFFILLGLEFLLRFGRSPTRENYVLAGVMCALAFAIKLSGLALFPIFVLAYPFFTEKKMWSVKTWLFGIVAYMVTAFLFAIPDVLFFGGNYLPVLKNVIFETPRYTSAFSLPLPYWLYIPFVQFPLLFGHTLFFVLIAAGVFFIYYWRKFRFVRIPRTPLAFSVLCASVFWASLVPLKIFGAGNRALVLLPFFALWAAITIEHLQKFVQAKAVLATVCVLLIFQIAESLAWMSVKWLPDPRQTSSRWIEQYIPAGAMIGLENVPVYQMIPDILRKDFYAQFYSADAQNIKYRYQVLYLSQNTWPEYVALTNTTASVFDPFLQKQQLIDRLLREGYKEVAVFTPDFRFLRGITNVFDFSVAGIIPAPVDVVVYR